MEKNCFACGSSRFRLSRFRLSDFPRLLALQYPVRCVSCQERSYAPLPWIVEHKWKRSRRK
jgi:hypothetical protein